MAWFKGTATDWLDMMDILSSIGDDEHMSAVTIYDGGSGYAIDDTISLSTGTYDYAPELEVRGITSGDTVATISSIGAGGTGYAVGDTVKLADAEGTYYTQAILEVTSVSGGVVTGLQINNPGIYSVQPSNPVTTTALTGSGDDALTVNLTWNSGVTGIVTSVYITSAGAATATPTNPVATTSSGSGTGFKGEFTWTETAWVTDMNFQPQQAVSATISAGGTGYSVGDLLNVVGGTYSEVAVFEVDTVAAGVVTAVSVTSNEGFYSTTPSNPASTSSTMGGSGCTLTITWEDYNTSTTQDEKHMIMHNSNEDVYFGIRAYNYKTPDADVWSLNGFSGFNSISTKYWNQPGYDANQCYVPLHDSSFDYYLSITDRRIIGIFNVGSGSLWANMYVGLIDPFMTEDEYPYPNLILGCISEQKKYTYSDLFGGMHNPGAIQSNDLGPGRLCFPDGVYNTIRNWYMDSGNAGKDDYSASIQPIGDQYPEPYYAADKWYYRIGDLSWYAIVRHGETDSTYQDKLRRFNDEYMLIPCLCTEQDSYRLFGTMTDVYWFDNADGDIQAGDRLWVNGVAYRAFPNCKLSNKNNYFCIKEG